ncbi:MAG: ArsR family transcriptional regulator [Candidatus Nitrosotenuis sp.]|nr:MAG: ArsR family transcriptional regulator [Candidatus Nitrosotenuis sp.]
MKPFDSISQNTPDAGIKVCCTEDDKLKSIGKLLISDSSRMILKVLFSDTMTANQISQKTGISLQLVKYHVNKMQEMGIVRITKIEKSTKSYDMKYYSAEKFAITIMPSKQGTPFAISFKKIHKIIGLGIAVFSAWFATHVVSGVYSASQTVKEIPQMSHHDGPRIGSQALDETLRLARARVDIVHSGASLGSGTPYFTADGFFGQIIIIGAIMASLSAILFWKAHKHQKTQFQPFV